MPQNGMLDGFVVPCSRKACIPVWRSWDFCWFASEDALGLGLDEEDEALEARPVMKVVKLLQEAAFAHASTQCE